MTGALDTKMRAVAENLISRFGKAATWVHVSSVTPNPATGTASRTTTSYSVTISPPQAFDPSSMRTATQFDAGDVSTSGEVGVTLAASGLAFTPAVGDLVTIDSKTWQVVGVQPIYSGELVAAYSARIVA